MYPCDQSRPMSGSDRFASIVDPGEETKMSPVVVLSTVLLILGFALSVGYRLLFAAG